MLKSLHKRGDTIVEVLICMAIISITLSLAYGIANNSVAKVETAEEKSQSVQLAQQQLERFKNYLKTSGTPISQLLPSGDNGFCIYNDLKLHYITTDPKDPICALNVKGQYYCENLSNVGCPAPTTAQADDHGYIYRAGIAYPLTFVPAGDGIDQFYAIAGRYQVNGEGANQQNFDVVVIPYRIHQ